MKLTSLLTTAATISILGGAAMAQAPAPATPTPPGAPAATPPAQPATPGEAASTPAAPSATAAPVVAKGDIIQTAQASGQFKTFLKAVDATNLTSLLKTTQNLTVFAPTDAAFAALPPGELDRLMADKASLQKLLTHHVINARVDSGKIKGARGEVATVAGDKVLLDGSGDQLIAGNADIVQPDVMATNGVLHVVDKVIIPGAPAATGDAAAASTTAPEAPATQVAPQQAAPQTAPPAGAPGQ